MKALPSLGNWLRAVGIVALRSSVKLNPESYTARPSYSERRAAVCSSKNSVVIRPSSLYIVSIPPKLCSSCRRPAPWRCQNLGGAGYTVARGSRPPAGCPGFWADHSGNLRVGDRPRHFCPKRICERWGRYSGQRIYKSRRLIGFSDVRRCPQMSSSGSCALASQEDLSLM